MLLLYQSMVDTSEQMELITRVYTDYRKLMKALAFNILQSNELAEDAVHDTMVRLIELVRGGTVLREAELKGFVCRLVRCRALDIYRKEKRRGFMSLEDEELRFLPNLETKDDMTDMILSVLEKLPATYREILGLRVQYDLSTEELGKALNISYENARKRLQRAMRAFEKVWRESMC